MPSRASVPSIRKGFDLMVRTSKIKAQLSMDLICPSAYLFYCIRYCDIFFMNELRNLNVNELMKKI